MLHMREAQAKLSSLPTAGDIYHQVPHQANSIEIIADQVAQRLLETLQPAEPAGNPPDPVPPHQHQANALQQRETSLQAREAALQQQMVQMQSMMANLGRNPHDDTRNFCRGGGRGGAGRGNNRNPQQRTPRQYCWSQSRTRSIIIEK